MTHFNQNNNEKIRKLNYIDITCKILNDKKQEYKIIKQQYFIADDGKKYEVDNKHVIFAPSNREVEVSKILGEIYGGNIKIIPRVNEPEGIKTPDYIIKDEKFDLKEIKGAGKNTLYDAIGKKKRQATNFVFDITKTKIDEKEAIRQIINIYYSKHTKWVNRLILIEKDKVLRVYQRG